MQCGEYSVGTIVQTPTRPSYTGTVIADHGNGIVRVEWHGITRRGDREVGENPRKRYPYVSDVGIVALTRVESER
jgi:hypothetical protein